MPALSLDAEKVAIGADNKPAEIIRFTDISTKEPDTSLFEIPSGYNPSPPPPSR